MESAFPQETLRVLIADDDASTRHLYAMLLRQLSHDVVGVAANGDELGQLYEEVTPDLVITDVNMPHGDGIAASTYIWRRRPLPILLISAHYDGQLLSRTQMDHVMAYLRKPVSKDDLAEGIRLALRRFGQFELLRAQALSAAQVSSDWHAVCQAKQILQKNGQRTEDAAFQRLHEVAQATNQGIALAAQSIILAHQLIEK
jgi:response regulator NasT